MKEVEAALKKYPNERMLKVEHATVLSDTGKVDEAAAEMRSLLGGDRDRETYLSLAQIFEKGKRYTDMGKVLDEAKSIQIERGQGRRLLHARRHAGTDQAVRRFGSRIPQSHRDESGERRRAELSWLHAGGPQCPPGRGISLIKKALDLDPDNGAYLDSLGWVYYRQGKLAEAESALVRAIDKIGQDGTVHDHLGDVYFKLGKTKEAIAQWQASIRDHQAGADADPAEVAKVTKKLDEARVRLAQETKK